MRSIAQRRSTEDQRTNTVNKGSSKGVSAPAVPVLQHKAHPAQLISRKVIQRVKVGDPSHGSIFLAVTHFPEDIYSTVKTVLDELKTAATDFVDATAIVAAVNADARVIAARAGSVEICTLNDGKKLRQRHIDAGTWALITPVRRDRAYELTTQIDAVTYKLHVHPPRYAGNDAIPGEVMKAGSATGSQTSAAAITAILAAHGRPAGW
ncbi:hypothetical protein ACFGVR_23735 [Mucilaginibacter sp. AW1-3]